MATRHSVTRSYSNICARVDDPIYDEDNLPSQMSTKTAVQRSSSSPPGVKGNGSSESSQPRSVSVAQRNLELLMSDGSQSHSRRCSGIERRRQSLRKKSYVGCETVTKRLRKDQEMDDDSILTSRSPRSSFRGSFSDRSTLSLKEEEWDALKETLSQLA